MAEKNSKIKRLYKKIHIILLLVLIVLVILSTIYTDLPNANEIINYQPPSTVNPQDFNWNRKPNSPVYVRVSLRRISPWLQKAVIISEDDTFYQHNGINYTMLKEAFRVNWEKRRYARGASTITMQLARNAFLHRRKTLLRKVQEIILTRRIERHMSKQQILEHYLNIAEWGENIYGVEAASRYYFSKSAANLSLAEASLLASMLPNPKYFNPFIRMNSCKRMQKRVLWLLQNAHEISPELEDNVFAEHIYLRGMYYHSDGEIDIDEEEKYLMPDIPELDLKPRGKIQRGNDTLIIYDN